MLVRQFNKMWESERATIETTLISKLDNEIRALGTSASMPSEKEEWRHELHKIRANLILRKAFAVFESEEIVRHRLTLRSSYLAVFMSGVALIISVTALFLR